MNIALTNRGNLDWVERQRARNDTFRRTLSGGVVVLSAGILALGGEAQACLLAMIRSFDDFDADDPFDVHDIGDFEFPIAGRDGEVRRVLVFFRIVDATGPGGTSVPVLTLMLGSEW